MLRTLAAAFLIFTGTLACAQSTLLDDWNAISRHQTRIPGSEGEAAVIDRAEAALRRLGARTRRETFTVTIPDPKSRGYLSDGSESVTVDPVWPNVISTSTCDVEGQLIYGRSGRLEDLAGQKVAGAIVVLDFDSGNRWLDIAALGASAVVFLESGPFGRVEAESKFALVPVRVPRFVGGKPLLRLLGRHVRLRCDQRWTRSTSTNLIADFAGSSPAEQIVLFSYADATSFVPGRAPGAEQGSGLAAALDLARKLTREKNRRTLRVVVSGAHTAALQGARQYIDQRFIRPEPPPLLVATLDLATRSSALGVFGRGYAYDYRDEGVAAVQPIARKLRQHAEELAQAWGETDARLVLTDAVNHSDNRTWRNNIPAKFAFDCEPFNAAGYNAITFSTVDDGRANVDTPSDVVAPQYLRNLERQISVLELLFKRLLNDPLARVGERVVPLEVPNPRRLSLIGGFGTVSGFAALFEPSKSLVPDQPIPGALVVRSSGKGTLMGVRADEVQMANDGKAEFRFVGVPPITNYSSRDKPKTRIDAFHLGPQGTIDMAPDQGAFGSESYPTSYELKVAEKSSPIVLFRCEQRDIYGLSDPQDFTPFEYLLVRDPAGGGEFRSFGLFEPLPAGPQYRFRTDASVLFIASGQPVQIRSPDNRLLLTNSTTSNEAGAGYESLDGSVAYHAAKDMIAINGARLDRFKKYRMISGDTLQMQEAAMAALSSAEHAAQGKQWAEAERFSRSSWALAMRAHPVLQKTANDLVNGVVFYSFLLAPFAYFLERLLVASRSLAKQLGWGAACFAGSFAVLRGTHPAFDLVSNPAMIFIGFVLGALSLFVIIFIAGKFESSLHQAKMDRSGVRELDLSRSNVAVAAVSIALGSMRRRKARTLLTVATLALVTFIVLSFTSIVPANTVAESPSPARASYPGLLLRQPDLEALPASSFDSLTEALGGKATLTRKVYGLTPDILDGAAMALQRGDKWGGFSGVLGLDALETEVSRPQQALLQGRWFQATETFAIILPDSLASKLSAEVGDDISYMGQSYRLVGIFSPQKMKEILDLDGESILPPDFNLSKREQQSTATQTQAFRKFTRLSGENCVIIPAAQSLALGGTLRAVSAVFPGPAESGAALRDLMPRLRLNLYGVVDAGGKAEVRRFSLLQGSKTSGLALVIIQLVIAGFFILNTMIASVYERVREIGILSAIGLAPHHISQLFFAEAAIYGVIASVIGYFAAQVAARILIAFDYLPELTLNFSSGSAILSACCVLAVVLASAAYPAKVASKLANPATKEVDREGPTGDEWTITLPFNVPEPEAGPIIRFLGDWIRAHERYSIGSFVSEETALTEGGASSVVWLTPYDLSVAQKLELFSTPSAVAGTRAVQMRLERVSGEPGNWVKTNERFLGDLRRQFLRWRALSDEERRKFA